MDGLVFSVLKNLTKYSDEDSTIAFNYLIQTVLGIIKDYQERNSEDALKKYLA